MSDIYVFLNHVKTVFGLWINLTKLVINVRGQVSAIDNAEIYFSVACNLYVYLFLL